MRLHVLIRGFLALLFCASALYGQSGADSTCYYSDAPATRHSLSLPHGYRLELRRDDDATSSSEFQCIASVKDARDSVVWTARGFGASLHPWTGHDVDGDGNADAILVIDTGGGNRCCREYSVLRLRPAVGVALHLEANAFFTEDVQGKTIIWQRIAFYDLGPSMAESPTALIASRLRASQLEDVTTPQCAHILRDSLPQIVTSSSDWQHATPAMRAASRRAATPAAQEGIATTRVAVMSLVLQHLACGLAAEAATLVTETWPAAEAPTMLARLRTAWIATDPRTKR